MERIIVYWCTFETCHMSEKIVRLVLWTIFGVESGIMAHCIESD